MVRQVPEFKIMVPSGVNVDWPNAVKVFPVATVRAPFTVVVPLVAPSEIAVAAPPILRVVAVVLNKLAVVFAAIRSEVVAPSMVMPFEAVTAPVRRDAPSTVNVPFAWMSPAFEIVTPLVPAYPPPTVRVSKLAVAPVALIVVAFGSERVSFLIVAVPVVPPIFTVVAAPPIFMVVAPVLKRLADEFVVVNDPPLTAMLPVVVISPVEPVRVKLEAVISLAPSESALTIFALDRSRAFVIAPPPVEVTLIAAGIASSVSWLSTRIN
jgi:hypothetical protein